MSRFVLLIRFLALLVLTAGLILPAGSPVRAQESEPTPTPTVEVGNDVQNPPPEANTGVAGSDPSAPAQSQAAEPTPTHTIPSEPEAPPHPTLEPTPAATVEAPPPPPEPTPTETVSDAQAEPAFPDPTADDPETADLTPVTEDGTPTDSLVAAAETLPEVEVQVWNCTRIGDETLRFYHNCSAKAGVSLAVIQNGAEVGTFTSDASGRFRFTPPEAALYALRYAGGNDPGWRPGANEEGQIRYGSGTGFFFVPVEPVVEWRMVVRAFEWRAGATAPSVPAGGGCYSIVDRLGAVFLGPTCDDDGDGVVEMGTLPAGSYFALAVTLPSGYAVGFPGGERAFGDEPGFGGDTWVGTLQLFTSAIRIVTIDALDQPVAGFCYFAQKVDASFGSGTVCDASDGANDGVVTLNRMLHGAYSVNVAADLPGLVADPRSQSLTLDQPVETVTFRAVPAGNNAPNTAKVDIRVVDQDGELPPGPFQFCFQLGSLGVYDSVQCLDGQEGRARFEDVPAGTHTLTLARRTSICEPPANLPLQVVVGQEDLGTTIMLDDFVSICEKFVPRETCVAEQEHERALEIYFGRLTDPRTGEFIATSL